jgi:hypothetical protein
MRFRKRNDLCLIHLVHGVGDFGRVLLSGKTVKEVAKEKQGAGEGKETYEDEHWGVAFPGNAVKYLRN